MSDTASLIALAQQYCMGNYGERKLALVRGQGAHVWDADGKRYVDCISGIGVNNIGHCHPAVVRAIQRQAETLLHVSNLYLIEPQVQLAKWLCDRTFASKAFFCNSGAEAIEAGLKLARKYARDRGYKNRFGFVCMHNSFHGRTLATVSATGQEKVRKGFDPLMPGFKYVNLNDFEEVQSAVDDNTCAILVEPVQGEGGIRCSDWDYLKRLRDLCDEKDLLLIFDEVQCGNGRTGKLYAYMHSSVEPDAMATAKALGGGVAIGALLASEKCEAVLSPGTHASTFGGNPLASAAALATLQALEQDDLCDQAEKVGEWLLERLEELKRKTDDILDVRGLGLMIGIEMKEAVAPIVEELSQRGFLTCPAGPKVLRLLPPLVVEQRDLQDFLNNLEEVLTS